MKLEQVWVNQIGCYPESNKYALLLCETNEAVSWKLVDKGEVVLKGESSSVLFDNSLEAYIHHFDFSDYTMESDELRVEALGISSAVFSISHDMYKKAGRDALRYFYHNRSGMAIEMPYAEDRKWTRPAGHIDVHPNRGDVSVTQFYGKDKNEKEWPKLDYTIDGSGGWYDAGDHGKYVVNGGISLWTLQNMYERTYYTKRGRFSDGELNIPESGNGRPDLLDECRFQMEFMLKMQIADNSGHPYPGMVHHKLADAVWTGLPMAPHDDPRERFVYPASTAATLNLAACAAQAARIWKRYDKEFSARCLEAAERAMKAAEKNSAMYAADNFDGSGPYDDQNVDDEFFWAVSELYVTTQKDEYKDKIERSSFLNSPKLYQESFMTWDDTANCGILSLVYNKEKIAANVYAAAENAILRLAEKVTGFIHSQPALLCYPYSESLPWGSNSFVVNNALLLAAAWDVSENEVFKDGVVQSYDYIFGRNPLKQSYVTGYGSNPLKNPHHRFWANQKDESYPSPPPGALSGGPNTGRQDVLARELLEEGRPPLCCFLDHIESWSTNEITINWNAPFAWGLYFLEDVYGK